MEKPIGITMGDPGGIGPELVYKLSLTGEKNLLIYTNFDCLKKFVPKINLSDPRLVNVEGNFDLGKVLSGVSTSVAGDISLSILRKAVTDCMDNKISSLITGPISKFS